MSTAPDDPVRPNPGQEEPVKERTRAEPAGSSRPGVPIGQDDPTSLGARQWFEALTDLIPQIVWSTRPDGYHDYYNERWYEYTGMPRTGDQGWKWQDYLHPDDKEPTLEAWHHALATGSTYDVRYRFRRAKDGEYRWFIGRAVPLRNAAGEIARWFGTCTDIHEERRTEQKLARLADFRRSLVSLIEVSLTTGRSGNFYQRVLEAAVRVIPGAEAGSMLFRAANDMFEYVASVGYDLDPLQTVRLTQRQAAFGSERNPRPTTIDDLIALDPLSPAARAALASAGRLDELRATLKFPITVDGVAEAYIMVDSFQSPDAFDEEAAEMARIFAGHVTTLVQRFRLEQKLHRLAFEDTLTGLPNRAALDLYAAEALVRTHANGGTVALLFLDLDGFKEINDVHGHQAGDEMLQVVARRLEESTRSDDYVARLGGDEFIVVLDQDGGEEHARTVADRILKALAQPIALRDGVVHASTSIGVAFFPTHGDTFEEVLRNADMAMYQAKSQGRDTYWLAELVPSGT